MADFWVEMVVQLANYFRRCVAGVIKTDFQRRLERWVTDSSLSECAQDALMQDSSPATSLRFEAGAGIFGTFDTSEKVSLATPMHGNSEIKGPSQIFGWWAYAVDLKLIHKCPLLL